jgi:hypothetical protein
LTILPVLVTPERDLRRRRHGDTFVDGDTFFAGHQICDSGSYLISVDWFDLGDSYHPKATGQAHGYLPAIDSVTG